MGCTTGWRGTTPQALPNHVHFEHELYRLNRDKTRQPVDTLFGQISLWRHLYRPVTEDAGLSSIAPLARALGVVANTTPALAEAAVRHLAEAGATQKTVQDQLRAAHGVSIGTGRLRELAEHVSGAMAEARQELQVDRLLDLLERAHGSSGNRKPVLSVGRDGVTLREYRPGSVRGRLGGHGDGIRPEG